MATKGKKTSSAPKASETVTRIKANDSKPTKSALKSEARTASLGNQETTKNPLVALGGYFKGSWYELRQVRWPDRRSTWSLTGAVLLFTAFFIIVILLLDALFKYLFELILG